MTTTTYLPDLIGWDIRRPTLEECELVGRDTGYAEPGPARLDDDDAVIEVDGGKEALEHFAKALELLGMCDAAHAIPAGVYLEE